jgi:quercetin dioxygenase-like cupin family protein
VAPSLVAARTWRLQRRSGAQIRRGYARGMRRHRALIPPSHNHHEALVVARRGTESEELNATLLSWRAGKGPAEHVTDGPDVLVVVLAGSALARTEEDERELGAGETTIIAKGRRRRIGAGRQAVRYLSVHRRRPPLQIARAPVRRS